MSTTDTTTTEPSDNAWDRLADERDLFETIVDEGGPYAPHAENILTVLDERQEGDDA
ncbi:hypothetical protein BJ1_gp29 [Halorubrum virus BJ1]|uniref:Uncharacterized protein n=1 Tax=Halorubrum virus BJ1 TaxID=416419 RepID=A0ZYP2_9CAUD|nr:hypothetical protein BJ1_gp29 [Halorubrum virus BJ1]CAL92451.1 hypothetical protein [Halorubrum virus BJ1]